MPSTLTRLPAWQALAQHRREQAFDMRALFATDPRRFDRYSLAHAGILLDYSKHLVTDETMQRLNNEVTGNKKEPAAVAKQFLQDQGLIKK